MSKRTTPRDTRPLTPVALQVVVGTVALFVASHVSWWAWGITLVTIAWVISRQLTAAWWDARKRRFGRELEARALADLGRMARLLRVPFLPNVPVAGLGDADAMMGRTPMVIEIKSWRRWDIGDSRCLDAIAQVERIMKRTDVKRALIWLPQGELDWLARLGFQPGMPPNIRVVAGPAWRPLWRVGLR